MKTAISIPDDVFDAAEKAARREGISRSKLYTRAIREHLKKEARKGIKQQLDTVYADASSELDPLLSHLQYEVWARQKW